jgi:hypothetical protein
MIGIEGLPVILREIQDILTIKPGERRRWLGDGRLPSAGTRTVQLAGRAKKITFHVFDPKVVEDLLNSGAVNESREDDVAAAAENRHRAAYKAKLTRSLKKGLGVVRLSQRGRMSQHPSSRAGMRLDTTDSCDRGLLNKGAGRFRHPYCRLVVGLSPKIMIFGGVTPVRTC